MFVQNHNRIVFFTVDVYNVISRRVKCCILYPRVYIPCDDAALSDRIRMLLVLYLLDHIAVFLAALAPGFDRLLTGLHLFDDVFRLI